MKMIIRGAGSLAQTRLIRVLALVALVLVVTSVSALASGGGEHGGNAGVPQLNPNTMMTQIFWLVVSFVALYFMLFGVALPRIESALSARESRISWDITKADEIRNQSNAVLASTDRMLARVQDQAREIIVRTSSQGQASGKTLMDRFDKELTRSTREAEARIVAAKNTALGELSKTATDLTVQVASRLAAVNIDSTSAAAAVTVAIKERS